MQTARAALFGLGIYHWLFPVTLGLVVILGSFNKGVPQSLTMIAVASAVLGVAAFAASRALKARLTWGYWFSLGVAGVEIVVAVAAIAAVVSGTVKVDGNPSFFVWLFSLMLILLALVVAVNLVRSAGWARTMGAPMTSTELTAGDVPDVTGATLERLDSTIVASTGSPTAGPPDAAAHKDDRVPLVAVRELRKHFPIFGGLLRRRIGTVYAVDGVDFDVYPGEIFSLVGESGCGKTTLGRTLLQLTPPTSGRVVFDGFELADVDPDDMRPLRRRMQIVFQDPFGSLNPRMPISDIIGEGLLAQGMTDRKARDKKVEDSLETVGLRRDYTRRYPHEFSGGQRQRVGIARAIALGPDFIVCDEPVSALDVSIQSQILNLLLDLRRDFNLTYLFISHNLSVVQYFSDRVGVMYLGKLAELGTVEQLYRDPRHPYTVALLSAIPNADPRRRAKRLVLKGDVPSPAAPPSGCRFHTRCWLRTELGNPERCATEEPLLRDFGGGHETACHFAEEISKDTVSSVVATQSVIDTAVADPA